MKNKVIKLFNDGMVNILATGILVLTQQFIVFPLISRNTTIEIFGMILIIIAFKNILMQVLGGSLNNLKLINYNKNDLNNYNLLLITSIFLAEIIAIALLINYSRYLTIIDNIFILVTIGLSIINIYGNVYYRLKLKYKRILMFNISSISGSLLGLLIYTFYLNNWTVIFFMAEVSAFTFLICSTPLFHDFSKGFRQGKFISSQYLNLLFSSVISNVIIYFDRVLISPLLGEKAVSQFYVASLTGKSFSLVVTPLNGVLLSYATRYKHKITDNFFKILGFLVLIFIIISLPFLNYISPFFINLLYPNIYEDSKHLIYLANIVVITGIGSSILNPFILIRCDLKWQSRINIIYGVLYLALGIILTNLFGLLGFCVSSIISNIIRLLLIYFVGIFANDSLSESEKKLK